MAAKGRALAPRRNLRSQKQQTRLRFSPLPSSSPATEGHTKTAQDWAADIRQDEVLYAVKQMNRDLVSQADGGLPTPQPSSQVPMESRESSSSPSLKRQAFAGSQLSPHGSGTDDDDEDPIQHSAKRRRVKADDEGTPVRRSGRLTRHLSARQPASAASERIASLMATKSPSQDGEVGLSSIGSPETTGDEDDVFMPMPTRRKHRAPLNRSRSSQYAGRTKSIRDDFLAEDGEIDFVTSEDEQPSARRAPRRERRAKQARRRTRDEQEELDADLEDLLDSGNEGVAHTSRTRGGPVTTKRDQTREHFALLKRRRAGERIPRIHDTDDDDVDDEDGHGSNLIGQPLPFVLGRRLSHPSIATDSTSHERSEAEDEDVAIAACEEVHDEDDDNRFIEEDDISDRGGRPHPDIPLEFTQFASAKPAELFIHVVEWLVKNKLAPGFARHDPLYQLAMDRVDDQVKAQAGSRLISSAWNATFKHTILARPSISIHILPESERADIRPCDACNKRNRPAHYDFVLTGSAYSRDTLEPVDDSDSEDGGGDDDDNASRDEAGHALASQAQHFYLGTHCAANAQMGHKLTHWKYHLNEAVMQYLEDQHVLSAESIIARDRMSNKKREKEAEAVLDGMESTGKIAELWKDFQNDLDDARLGMEDYQKKGGRSEGRIGVISTRGSDGIRREWRDSRYKETFELSDSD